MITIRPAVPDDAEVIADIRLTGWRETYARLLSADFLARMTSNPDRIRASIERGTPLIVAELDGEVVGFACASTPFGDRPAFLWVAEGNPRAIAFYRRNGFIADGTRKIAPDWENLAEIRMVR